MQYDAFRAMNSDILLAISEIDTGRVEAGFRQARQFITESEQRFTRFSETSELARLNRAAGSWVQVTDDLFSLLRLAHQLSVETDGLFNPAILPALKQAGYDRSMDDIRNALPVEGQPSMKVTVQDFRQVQFDPPTHAVLLPPGMQVDLGGIAKGWIAEQAARKLSVYADTCGVSAGGDMFLIGLPDGETGWEIGLEDPLDPEDDLDVLSVCPGAVATSSITKRKWQQNGLIQHHLIDPRSGEPAQTNWLSVTVWAEHAAEAEVYAKALLISGASGAPGLMKKQPQAAYLAVDRFGQIHGSENIREVLYV